MSAHPARLSRRSVAAVSVTAALSLTLAACGGSGDPSTVSPPSATTSSPAAVGTGTVDAAHNDADVAFITDMAPHHSGAIAMSALATTRAASPEVKALASRISKAQGPEIALMATMAKTWKVDPSAAGSDMGGMNMGGDATKALESLSGKEFDTQFLTRMIEHHSGALVMAKKELTDGQNAQAKELAQRIVSAQDTEIAEMRGMLTAA